MNYTDLLKFQKLYRYLFRLSKMEIQSNDIKLFVQKYMKSYENLEKA